MDSIVNINTNPDPVTEHEEENLVGKGNHIGASD